MAKIELTLVRDNDVGQTPLKINIDGSLINLEMVLEIIKDGIDKVNENIKNKYDLF